MVATRVGFIGAGWISEVHLRVLGRFDDVEVVAVTSRRAESAARLAAPIGAHVYTDYRSMYDRAELDAVFVCVPPAAHAAAELEAAERGIALFVEKPLGVDEDGPQGIAETIARSGVVSCVGYQQRYLSVVDRAAELLQANPPQLLTGRWLGETPAADWWIHADRSGGQIVEQATHVFDLMRYLAGEMEAVAAAGRRVERADYPDSDILDVTQTSVRFESGAIGSIETSCLLDGPHSVGLDTVSPGLSLSLEPLTARLTIRRGPETILYAPPSTFDTPYELQDRAFVDAVRGKPSLIRSSYEDALRTHRVTIAATRLANADAAAATAS